MIWYEKFHFMLSKCCKVIENSPTVLDKIKNWRVKKATLSNLERPVWKFLISNRVIRIEISADFLQQ